jgi:nucleoside-diphosphate-sugar epimerase
VKIVIMGGSGRLGKYIVDEIKKDHEVIVFDLKESSHKDVQFIEGNILSMNDCRIAVKGAEAIIHLAAIPNPLKDPPEEVFKINVVGTYNIHQAACDLGIDKVIHASSNSVYGFTFRREKDVLFPEYLPIDLDHPLKPTDPYGLSKKTGEEIAASFTERYGMRTIVMRLCFVWFPASFKRYVPLINDPGQWKPHFWAYEHARDAALVFRLALEAQGLQKHEVFLIAAEDNGTNVDSIELINKYYSNNIPFKQRVRGRQSLVDWTKAKTLLGYQPQYTWRDIV